MMRVLVLHAHPVAESLSGALHKTVVESLKACGHEVDDCDLYAENFEPVLSRAERLDYHDLEKNRALVAPYVDRVLAAQGLVIVAPVWNFGFPAILKGFFDRVFIPGVSFTVTEGVYRPALHHITKLTVVATYGADRARALLVGDPPRKIGTRVLRAVIKPFAPVDYLALYDMNNATRADCAAFIERVRKAMAKF